MEPRRRRQRRRPLSDHQHDLRHCVGTWLYEDGEDIGAIQDQLGHSSSAITKDIYIKGQKKSRRRVADRLDRILGDMIS